MITTFKEMAEAHGWEVGKTYEVNLWVGNEFVRNWKSVNYISETHVVVEAEDYYMTNTKEPKKRTDNKDTRLFDISHARLICAETEAEVLADIELRRKQVDLKVAERKNKIMNLLDQIERELSGLGWDDQRSIGKELDDTDRFDKVCYALSHAKSFQSDYSDEMMGYIREIFQKRSINYDNENDITNRIFIDQIVSVETSLRYLDKDCTIIHTCDNNTHYIYKEGHPDLYEALELLFG